MPTDKTDKVRKSEVYDDLPWQATQWRHLTNQLSSQRLPHALLLSGLKGLGKLQFASRFSQYLLCHSAEKSDKSCGQCKGCLLLAAETHPDFKIVQPEENSEFIKIDQIRELIDFFNYTALQNTYKVSIIYPAEAMNSAAANALLKTLEEPPLNKNLLLLVSHQASLLLPTIRSRCHQIQFFIPTTEQALTWLSEQHELKNNYELALGLAEGAPLTALAYLKENKLAEIIELLNDLENLQNHQVNFVANAKKWSEKDSSEFTLLILFLLVRMLHYKLARKICFSPVPEINNQLMSIADRCDLANLFSCLDFIYEQRKVLLKKITLNAVLLTEAIFYHFSK